MKEITQLLEQSSILPILVIQDEDDASLVGQALVDSGVPIVEVVLRSDAAMSSIRTMADAFPELQVGCGTVLSVAQAEEALANGASFIVTPGLDEEIVAFCQERNVPVVPGCMTPTEVQEAYKMGLRVLKFFPAVNGEVMLTMLQGPFADVRFIPTGGISENNMGSLLQCKNVLAVGGAWMFAKNDALKNKNYEAICENIHSSLKIKEEIR